MDILGWLWWLILHLLGWFWAVVWLLLGGWVATLAQIAVIVFAVFAYKYGWRRAPREIASRLLPVWRLAWGWLRGREIGPTAATASRTERHEARCNAKAAYRRRRQPGDVNVSTLLNLLLLTGLGLLATM